MAISPIKNKAFFVVDGNIGAGKTTFLRIIAEYIRAHVVYEPTAKWQKIIGHDNLLEKFYNDTPRWAYTFQSYAFITRIMEQEAHALQYTEPIHILERSVFSDRYCFAQNCHELGLMSDLEWELYKDLFSWLVDNYVIRPHGFIYLQVDPEVCYQRINHRNRSEEKGISLDYLTSLHQKHEDWLIHKKGVAPYVKDIPVLTLNCNEDFQHSTIQQKKHVDSIIEFIDTYTDIDWKKTACLRPFSR